MIFISVLGAKKYLLVCLHVMLVWKLIATFSQFGLLSCNSYLTIVTLFAVLREKSQNYKICTSAELWDKNVAITFIHFLFSYFIHKICEMQTHNSEKKSKLLNVNSNLIFFFFLSEIRICEKAKQNCKKKVRIVG